MAEECLVNEWFLTVDIIFNQGVISKYKFPHVCVQEFISTTKQYYKQIISNGTCNMLTQQGVTCALEYYTSKSPSP